MTGEIKNGTTEEQRKPSLGSGFWFPFLFIASWLIFHRLLPFYAAMILAGVVSAGGGYFTLPKPRPGFVKFFLYEMAVLAAVLAALWLVPEALAKIMPEFWAYSLPALLLFNTAYFLPPLIGSRIERGAWWKWLLGSLLFAGIYGWAISS